MGTSLHQTREGGKNTNYNQAAFNDGTLVAVKPHTKNKTIIRIIPETDANGNPVPMVNGQDENGYKYSNVFLEPIAFGTGLLEKYTGSVIPGDMPGMPELDRPFQGLFVTVKGRVNKQNLAQHELGPVLQVINKPGKDSPAPLQSVQNSLLVQCSVFQLDDKPCNPPMDKVGIILSSSALKSLDQTLTQAARTGIDVFHPTTGYTIEITGIPGQNGGPASFVCNLGHPMPIPDHVWKNAFIPWERVIKRHSYDDLVKRMEKCFGAAIVAMRGSFREALVRLGYTIPALGMPAQSAPGGYPSAPAGYQVPVQPAAQQAPAGWVQPTQQQVPVQPAAVIPPAPIQAPAGWGAPPAAAVVPTAPVGWGAPTQPVATTPVVQAPAATQAPTVSSAVDLQKMFNEANALAAAQVPPKTA